MTGATGATGPTGPTGPTGVSDGLASYAGRYNTTPQTLQLVVGGSTQVPLPSTMPVKQATYTPTNSITITEDGVYDISYSTNVSAAIATTLTVAVRQNGVNIPEATISRALAVGVNSLFSGEVIVTLVAGAVIDMAVSALLAVGVTLGSGVNATLTLKKLD